MTDNQMTVYNAINTILNDESPDVTEAVIERLSSFGVELSVEQSWMVAFCIMKAQNHILNYTHQTEVPEGLFNVYVDMCCGQILNDLLSTGQIDEMDLIGITQITEGDTSVSLDANGGVKGMISQMMEGGEDLICYRKIKW